MTVATFFKLLGLIAAAGLHPIVTLLGLSLAGTGSSRPSSAIRILSSPVTTIVLAGLLALEMVGSRLGRPLHAISKFLTRFGHMPLALGAGGPAAASQLQTHSVQHLALPVAGRGWGRYGPVCPVYTPEDVARHSRDLAHH